MKKHGGKNGGISSNGGVDKIVGHQAVVGKQCRGLIGVGDLPVKSEDIPSYQYNGEQGKMLRRIFVVKRDKHVFLSG